MAPSSINKINDTADVQLLPPPKLIANPSLQWSHISGISKIINLHKARSFKTWTDYLSPSGSTVLSRIPVHYVGAFTDWPLALSAIYTFNSLPPTQQTLELNKSKHLPSSMKKIYNANIDYLHNNPLIIATTPRINTISKQHDDMELNNLVASSAARARMVSPINMVQEGRFATKPQQPKTTVNTTRRGHSTTRVYKKKTVTKKKINSNKQINHELVNTKCPTCGFILTPRIYKFAIQISDTEYDCLGCIQCIEGKQQYDIAIKRNNNLQHMYDTQQSSPKSNLVSNESVHVNLQTFVTQQLGKKNALDIIRLYNKTKLNVNVIDMENNNTSARQHNNKVGSINGATWNVNNYTNPHPNMIAHDERHDFTVLKLRKHKNGQDFFVISNSHHDKKSVNQFCAYEMNENISQGVTGSRAGPASGFMQLENESFSYTPITQKATSLKVATSSKGKGVAMRKLYYNNKRQVKLCNFGYNKLAMKRLNKKQKRELALRYTFYNNILVKEALAYIASMACVVSAGISLSSVDGNYFSNLSQILADNIGESIEHCLVLWMTSTGEMRNHQALACHTDTNRSHDMEIYSLFHRTGSAKKDGLLYLPLDNACVRVVCDEQVVVCCLSCTPHVPDQSRNTHNMSKVHGPIP